MEWDDAQVLLALLRARNLNDAGARLGLDPSTLSRRLARLEKLTDARLFVRTRDGLRPTAVAERLRPHAEAMAAGAASLESALRAGETRTRGLVRVATTEAFARALIGGGLLGLRQEHPDLVVEVLAGNRSLDLASGEADLAVRVTKLQQQSLRARCVGRMGIGLFAAPDYLRARGTVRTLGALRGHDVLLATGELSNLPEAKWLASHPHVRVAFRSNSMPALVAAAIAAQGIVPLPLGWGKGEAGLERLIVIDALPERKIWLVTHDAATRRPAVRLVADYLAAILGRLCAH